MKRFGLVFFGVCLLLNTYAVGAVTYDYVRLPLTSLSESFVRQTGFIRDHKQDDTYAFGYLKSGITRRLPRGLRNQLVELNARDWATHQYDAKTLQLIPSPAYVGPYEYYHTYETLTAELKALAQKYPDFVKLASAGKSVEGRDLWYLRITSSRVADTHKPKLLYISSMHGDEVTGKEMMVYLLRGFLSQYGRDPRLTMLIDYAEIFVMPSMNPDGTEKQQRFNANGVDLNRDFPGLDEPAFATAGRAPETIALMELHRNNHFDIALNFHGGALVINIPWDSKPNPDGQHFGDDALMLDMANAYANNNAPMFANTQGSFIHGITYGYEWYQILGGMQDWADFFRQSTHATLEISEVKWPDATSLPGFWSDNRESLLRYLEVGMRGFHLAVTDSTGKPIDADVDIATATRTLHYPGGFVHRPATGTSQKVTVKAAGYQPKTLMLEPKVFDGRYEAVVLQ